MVNLALINELFVEGGNTDVFCHADTDNYVVMLRLRGYIPIIANKNFHGRV